MLITLLLGVQLIFTEKLHDGTIKGTQISYKWAKNYSPVGFFSPLRTKMVGKLIPLLLGILISQGMATHTAVYTVHQQGSSPRHLHLPEKGDHDECP